MEFKFKSYIPSIDTFVPTKQLTTRDYIELVKYVTNGDSAYTLRAYDELIETHCEDVCIQELNRVDKFFILIMIRAVCVGPILSLTYGDDIKKTTARVSLVEMLQKIANINFQTSKTISVTDNIKIKVNIPNSLCMQENIVAECVDSITIKDVTTSLRGGSVDGKLELIDQLPGSVYKSISDYIKTGIENYSSVELFKKPGGDERYVVNVFDNSLYDFVNLCYKESLNYLKDVVYILVKRCRFDSELIMNSTFAEIRMYVDMYEEEIKEQQKQATAQENKSKTPAIGPTGGLNL